MRNNKKGFTLAELTISLAILGLIASGLMTLTASTIKKVYERRMNFLFKNECQMIASCFSISELVINSGAKSINIDSLIDLLDFAYSDNITRSEYEENGITIDADFKDHVEIARSNNKVIISWTYDVNFRQDSSQTQYTCCLYINFTSNISDFNPAEASIVILRGDNPINSLDNIEDNPYLSYSELYCLVKEVPTI